jgi:Tfp pilus assembly PilM family ATPase
MTKNVVGIELTHSQMRVCALLGKANRMVTTHLSTSLPNTDLGAEHLDTLTKFVKVNRLQGSPVSLSLPNDKVVVRYMQLPDLPVKALRQTVEVELGTSIHLPFDDPVYDVVPVPCINQRELQSGYRNMCLISAPSVEVEHAIAMAQGAGLRPTGIDVTPMAILRCSGTSVIESDGLTCLIQVSRSEMVFSIFIGDALYFFRSVEMASELDVPAVEEGQWMHDVAFELERVINFFNFNLSDREREVDRVLLHAQDCDRQTLCQVLSQRLQRDVTVLVASAENTCEGPFMTAVGLALKGRVNG